MNYKIAICILFSALISNLFSYAYANQEFQIESKSWSDIANQVHTLVKENKFVQAKNNLKELATQFSSSDLADKNLTIDAVNQLSGLIINTDRSLNLITPDKKNILRETKRLLFAFDAVSHKNQPMWKSYYNTFIKHVNAIESAKENKQKLSSSIQALDSDYQLVRPAFVVSKSPSTVNQLDSLIKFIQTAKSSEIGTISQELKNLLKVIFLGSDKQVLAMYHPLQQSPTVFPIVCIFCFIIFVLGIVSWQKYKAIREVDFDHNYG